MDNYSIVIDVETGGLDCSINPITQISLLVVHNQTLENKGTLTTYVKPYKINDKEPIYEPKALQYTGITMAMINGGVDIKFLVKELIALFKQYSGKNKSNMPYFIGHNIHFDMGFLEVLFSEAGEDLYKYTQKSTVCTLRQTYQRWPNLPKYTLGACCEHMGIELIDAHDAENDVLSTFEVYKHHTLALRGSKIETSKNLTGEIEINEHRLKFKI